MRSLREVLPKELKHRVYLTSQSYVYRPGSQGTVRNLTTGPMEFCPPDKATKRIGTHQGLNICNDSFTSRVLVALKQLPGKWVLFVQEDHWYSRFLSMAELQVVLGTMEAQDANACKLNSKAGYGRSSCLLSKHYGFNISKITDEHGYTFFPVSHHATIFRREWLMNNLEMAISKRIHTPWQHELWCQDADVTGPFQKLLQLEDSTRVRLLSVVTSGKLTQRGKAFLASSLWEECAILANQLRENLENPDQPANTCVATANTRTRVSAAFSTWRQVAEGKKMQLAAAAPQRSRRLAALLSWRRGLERCWVVWRAFTALNARRTGRARDKHHKMLKFRVRRALFIWQQYTLRQICRQKRLRTPVRNRPASDSRGHESARTIREARVKYHPQHLELLINDPSLSPQFDLTYGAGAAALALSSPSPPSRGAPSEVQQPSKAPKEPRVYRLVKSPSRHTPTTPNQRSAVTAPNQRITSVAEPAAGGHDTVMAETDRVGQLLRATEEALRWLEGTDLRSQGSLWRKPGHRGEMERLEQGFERGGRIEFETAASPHDVCGVLLRLIQQVPGGVLGQKTTMELIGKFRSGTAGECVRIICGGEERNKRRLLAALLGHWRLVGKMYRVDIASRVFGILCTEKVDIKTIPVLARLIEATNKQLRTLQA
eukprot:TRINITY_DN56643_c0_g1_i1.p1 TRINITY_DN56643_c0_g1~~TRINITY_DN56643_c0_g1_i1.p1  ORF type:complete len:659 (-),score=48.78 TRINITY_DN56643_c0_g1_i1:2-1978(-)